MPAKNKFDIVAARDKIYTIKYSTRIGKLLC